MDECGLIRGLWAMACCYMDEMLRCGSEGLAVRLSIDDERAVCDTDTDGHQHARFGGVHYSATHRQLMQWMEKI